ncbi:hypothetical protein [Sutcliffiella rhizosphaerae]|uniref:Uncharacterized protein n=1 Tax=Sutcliffiella rhizosphaerae TaxID=2880967 RepID=A0ABM8YK25_9BACI|nr:hypothetical protein [Sutcliffiella rhizosphaerae]CAG9620284.1 hypothetical protein BACCIP111883_01052 [Sutcliffiella rhizosphaerae]
MTENSKIPKLELEKFVFSPPGPMGWNMAEYEKMLKNPDQLVLNETTVHSQLEALSSNALVELSLSGKLSTNKHRSKDEEVLDDEDIIEIKVEEEVEEIDYEHENEENLEEDIEEELEEEEVIEEEIEVPKIKVTIVVEDSNLKLPWISINIKSSPK